MFAVLLGINKPTSGTTRCHKQSACVCAKSLSRVQFFTTPWTVACQASLSMVFSRQEYWSRFPCPPPEDFPNPGTEPASLTSPALAGGFFTASTTWEAPIGRISQFSRSGVSDSLWPHGLQLTRPPCPSPTPRVYSNWCPLSWWCHPTISSSVVPFSSRLQSLPASGSFQMSQFFMSGGQSIGVSVLIGRIVVLQRCLCPDPWNRWTCFLTWQNRFYRGDERSWDGEIGLSKWPQYNHKGHIKERGR